ncbi:hypothetical protein GCM10025864_22410 [Luteimicrobium album]|uniref:DUF222 domain-containing protein n=1 Tax=Luteimicrobium album TaxID=1054550 RepID=A0ABQ6I2L4_9MICO|nr:hypothetical protein GCM10025864_22410 [Luteimicrobium album]
MLDEAQVLVGALPATVAGMRAGRVSYRHAQAVVEHTGDLDPSDRAEVETAALPVAGSMPPGAFGRHVARCRERRLAEPVNVRHERAAARRWVRVEPARDGMAFLTAYLPAATACAVEDRIDRAVAVLGGPDEPRTVDQLRADVLSALLLDDGTLDLAALSLQVPVADTGLDTDPSHRPGGPDGSGTERPEEGARPGCGSCGTGCNTPRSSPTTLPGAWPRPGRRWPGSRAASCPTSRSPSPSSPCFAP